MVSFLYVCLSSTLFVVVILAVFSAHQTRPFELFRPAYDDAFVMSKTKIKGIATNATSLGSVPDGHYLTTESTTRPSGATRCCRATTTPPPGRIQASDGGEGARANATAPAPGARFTIDGLDWRGTPACGANKCFYEAVRPRAATDGRGFLVTQTQGLESVRREWEASEYLAARYGRRHFLRGAPARHNISEHLAGLLNRRIPRKKQYTHRAPVVVQEVQTAPQSLLIGCLGNKRTSTLGGPGSFIEQHVIDGEIFVSNLQRELKSTLVLMEREPWYAADWQALVDPNGTLFEIDVASVRLEAVVTAKVKAKAKDAILNCYEVLQTFFDKAEAAVYGTTKNHTLGQYSE